MNFSNKKPRNLSIIIPLLIVGTTTFLWHYYLLSRSSYANGKDAYWYVIQMRSLLETGSFHAPEYSPFYIVYALAMQITRDYIVGLRLSLCFISLFFGFSVAGLFYTHLEKKRMIVASLLFCLSPALFHMSIQYAKQALALSFLFAGLSLLFYALKNKESKRAFLVQMCAICFLMLSFFSHRLMSALILYWFVSILALYLISFSRKFITSKNISIIIVGLATLLPLLYLLPRGLSVADMGRLNVVFKENILPQWHYMKYYNLSPLAFIEIMSFLMIFFILLSLSIYKIVSFNNNENYKQTIAQILKKLLGLFYRPSLLFVLIVASIPILIIFNIPLFDFFDLQVRLLLTAIPFSMVLLLLLMQYVYSDLNQTRPTKKVSIIFTIFMTGFILLEIFFQLSFYNPSQFEHDYRTFDIIIQKQSAYTKNKDMDLIIAHTGLAAYYDYKIRKEALAWAPEKKLDRDKIWRFVYGIQLKEIQYRLLLKKDTSGNSHIYALNKNYLLIREDIWEQLIQYSKKYYDEEFDRRLTYWKNPTRIRPAYLKK